MAKTVCKLTALAVARLKSPGLHNDGGGLNLQIGPTGGKAWVFRYSFDGKSRYMGLGAVDAVDLAAARDAAADCRRMLALGTDPAKERDDRRAEERRKRESAITFQECADRYIAAHRAGWRSPVHAAQWTSTIKQHAGPIIGALPVADIDTDDVLRVLRTIWETMPETAGRLRGRIEAILDFARVSGLRPAVENPARWKGHLALMLPPKARIHQVRHHPALEFDRVPDFLAELVEMEGVGPEALAFLILNANRTNEVLGGKWPELDLDNDNPIWTVPASRMKGRQIHRVPLAPASLEILKRMERLRRRGDYIFPGTKPDTQLSAMTLEAIVRRMNKNTDPPKWRDFYGDPITIHGFRSAFKDFAAEMTSFPNLVSETALAHATGTAVERAYRRGDLLDKRRDLMKVWADHCTKKLAGAARQAVEPTPEIEEEAA